MTVTAYLTREDIARRFRKPRTWAYRAAAFNAYLARIEFPAPIAPGLWHPEHVKAWEDARWPAHLSRPQALAAHAAAANDADIGRAAGSPMDEAAIEDAVVRFFTGAQGDRAPAQDQPARAAE